MVDLFGAKKLYRPKLPISDLLQSLRPICKAWKADVEHRTLHVLETKHGQKSHDLKILWSQYDPQIVLDSPGLLTSLGTLPQILQLLSLRDTPWEGNAKRKKTSDYFALQDFKCRIQATFLSFPSGFGIYIAVHSFTMLYSFLSKGENRLCENNPLLHI